MNRTDNSGKLVPIFVKIAPEDIVLIKFIMESYDGLAIVRTLNPLTGEVVILALEDTIREASNILEDLKASVNLRIIPPPESLAGDWLLT